MDPNAAVGLDEYEDLVEQHRMDDGPATKPLHDGRILRAHTKNKPELSWPELKENPTAGHPRYFIFKSLGKRNIYPVMGVWMNVAKKKNGEDLPACLISPVPLNQWYETNNKTGRTYRKKSVPECPMGRLLETPQEEVIARALKSTKPALNPSYYLEAFEVEFEGWVQKQKPDTANPGKQVIFWTCTQDPAHPGWPKMKVNPKAFIVEFRPNMMIELKDKVLVPKIPAPEFDDFGAEKPSTYVPLPSTNPSEILVKFEKVTEGDSSDPAMNVRYHLTPHPTVTFTQAFTEVDPLPHTADGFLDWATILPATDQEEVDRIVAKYFDGEVPEAKPAEEGKVAGAASKDQPGPVDDADIPF